LGEAEIRAAAGVGIMSCLSESKKNRQVANAGGFSGCLGVCLAQSLRQRLGKAKKIKPEGVHTDHFGISKPD
jgi:hypothetical protein